VRDTRDAFVHQFIYGEEDGPMRFHFPGGSMDADFGLGGARA
jgi:phospholipid/cholesterol/gamma-HCH transport system ATP-binding protein